MLGKSASPWEEVYATSHEVMERMEVDTGWLYRNRLIQGTDSIIVHISMTFVAAAGEPVSSPVEAPVNVDAPYVSDITNVEVGSAEVPAASVGDTLSSTLGNWNNEPTSYSFSWQRAGTVVGEDSSTYLLGPDDSGGEITCIVTATNAVGSTASPPSNVIRVK